MLRQIVLKPQRGREKLQLSYWKIVSYKHEQLVGCVQHMSLHYLKELHIRRKKKPPKTKYIKIIVIVTAFLRRPFFICLVGVKFLKILDISISIFLLKQSEI